MSEPFSLADAQRPALLVTPPLSFENVPHWGWRAREGAYRFEIERLEVAYNNRDRFRAALRRDGTSQPIAQRGFKTSIQARAWLELLRAEMAKQGTR